MVVKILPWYRLVSLPCRNGDLLTHHRTFLRLLENNGQRLSICGCVRLSSHAHDLELLCTVCGELFLLLHAPTHGVVRMVRGRACAFARHRGHSGRLVLSVIYLWYL